MKVVKSNFHVFCFFLAEAASPTALYRTMLTKQSHVKYRKKKKIFCWPGKSSSVHFCLVLASFGKLNKTKFPFTPEKTFPWSSTRRYI